MKRNWPIDEKGETCLFELRFCSMTTLGRTAALTREKLDKTHWKTPEHPSYSPDLSSCKYHVFGPLKEELGGHHIDDDDGVETFLRGQIRSLMTEFEKIRYGDKNMRIKKKLYRKIRCIQVFIYCSNKCSKTKLRFIFDSSSYYSTRFYHEF